MPRSGLTSFVSARRDSDTNERADGRGVYSAGGIGSVGSGQYTRDK